MITKLRPSPPPLPASCLQLAIDNDGVWVQCQAGSIPSSSLKNKILRVSNFLMDQVEQTNTSLPRLCPSSEMKQMLLKSWNMRESIFRSGMSHRVERMCFWSRSRKLYKRNFACMMYTRLIKSLTPASWMTSLNKWSNKCSTKWSCIHREIAENTSLREVCTTILVPTSCRREQAKMRQIKQGCSPPGVR